MTNPSTNDGLTKESTLIPKLTTLTNQRVTSSTLTVSDILNDNESLGLSRNSTLVLDPPVNYGDITITEPGQYLPRDFNSQGLYDPTHSAGYEYINQINVNKIKVEKLAINLNGNITYYNYSQLNIQKATERINVNINPGELLFFYNPSNIRTDRITIWYRQSSSTTTYQMSVGDNYFKVNVNTDEDPDQFYFTDINNNFIIGSQDQVLNDARSACLICFTQFFDFSSFTVF